MEDPTQPEHNSVVTKPKSLPASVQYAQEAPSDAS